MTTIYFDQFAISGLSGKDVSKEWGKIREVLFRLKRQRKIRCCTSPETIFETSQREEKENSNRIVENYDLILDLTDNCYLCDMKLLICQQIAKRVKGIDSDPFTYVPHDFTSREFNFSLKEIIHSEFDTIEIPPFPVEISKEKIAYLIKLLVDNDKITFTESICNFLTQKQSYPFYTDICRTLVECFNFTIEDFEQLLNQIKKYDLSISPTLKIRSMLDPYISFSNNDRRQKIKSKNDIFDISRISSAIPYCDVVLCDSKWKNGVQTLGLDAEYKTTLFSGKPLDLAEFEKFLLNL